MNCFRAYFPREPTSTAEPEAEPDTAEPDSTLAVFDSRPESDTGAGTAGADAGTGSLAVADGDAEDAVAWSSLGVFALTLRERLGEDDVEADFLGFERDGDGDELLDTLRLKPAAVPVPEAHLPKRASRYSLHHVRLRGPRPVFELTYNAGSSSRL